MGLLEKQLVLKQIMSIEDWRNIASDVKFDFAKDNYFMELKDAEIVQNRVQLVQQLDGANMVGRYYSNEWVRKQILRQSDDQIEEMNEQIDEESKDPRWNMEMMQPTGNEVPADDASNILPQQDDEAPQDDGAKKLEDAQKTYDRLSKMKHRTIQDESKYRSVIQILARNKGK